MSDLLVKLYELPSLDPAVAVVEKNGVTIRRALVPERAVLVDWVETHFSRPWSDECRVATSRHPMTCFVATIPKTEKSSAVIGFGCYNATFRGFFGPVGVAETHRGKGIGAALTISCLHALKHEGFAYGIIGSARSEEYFHKIAGATVIENSSPGPYAGIVRAQSGKT